MLVVVFNVGTPCYAAPALAVLKDYFRRYDHEYVIVNDLGSYNTKNAHPSWMKLLAHKMFKGYSFILNWDLDLLPIKSAHSIRSVLDQAKMNMAVDSSLLAGYPGFNINFKYNGGLMGIPVALAPWCEAIYEKHAPGDYPSYEQYYLNDAIVADKVPVNRLPDEVNTLYPRNTPGNALWRAAEMKHYTFGVMEAQDKLRMIQEHHDDYFKA